MNYYNPYFSMYPASYFMPTATAPASKGFISGILGKMGGINWGSILNNTQRTLGIVNQAIPVVKQVTPMFRNAKTMFQVMNEFKKVDTPTSASKAENIKPTTSTNSVNSSTMAEAATTINSDGGPTFFI